MERDLTPDEKAAVAQVTETLHLRDGRYEIGIPWKRGEPHLVNNYEMALNRLKTQEISLVRRGSEVANTYDEIIKDYERKGYVKKVPKSNEPEQWFLPHFPVIRQDRTTTKVRMVFDAAAKDNGKCLNDAVRLGLVEEDRRYHRFLWRDFDSRKDPDHYEFKRLLFGNRASPFCAQHVVHTQAKVHAADYPHAAETVDNSMYVDDVLDSFETVDEAIQLRHELSELLAMCNFKLRKWSSNDSTVLNDIPTEDRLQSIEIHGTEESPKIKTLGVLWESTSDVFTFRVQPPNVDMKLTKRNVLSTIATIFDPLQFLAPFTLRANILMQEIWIAGIGWDDLLTDGLIFKWKKRVSELRELSQVTIPRSLRLPSPSQSRLHVFSDASKEAYATVAYLVCRYSDESTTSRIVASKSRVAPTKAVTIPRLELMGAVLSTRLAKNISKTLEVGEPIFWTDSTNVLYWIRNDSREFKPFVANRIGEIHRSTNPQQWRHIPGESNPADLPTRGLSATEILQQDESTWPPQIPNEEVQRNIVEGERRKVNVTHTTRDSSNQSIIDPNRFSSFQRLVRVTGWVRRFLSNCKRPNENREKSRTLRAQELQQAETYWFKRTQSEAFSDGVKEKCLIQLNPKKDENGLLRSDGRLRNATDVPYGVRHPILLPKDHAVTRLIIISAHENLGHGSGVEHVLTELRARFWIIKGSKTNCAKYD